ncbi:MAG: efflux RND transporter permease subunit [Gemmataceae bacterium]
MFARVFIDRPVLAWVLSIVIVAAGLAALRRLPIAQYPEITPPTITVTATYPGANAEVVSRTVAAPLEVQVNGVENMLYMSSQCGNDGSYSLTVTFELGTDANQAQVLVQNRLQLALPQLPEEVQRIGLSVRKRSPDILLIANLFSPDGSRDQLYLSNYATIQVRDELARVPGVGDVIVFGQQDYSMRAWLDPNRLAVEGLTASAVVKAIREQNVQVAAGKIGQEPAPPGVAFQYTLSTLGRLETVEQFENIVVKVGAAPALADAGAAPPGVSAPATGTPTARPVVRLKDVARVELTARTQDITNTLDGGPAVGLAIFQLPGTNALDVADRVKAKLEQLRKRFPVGVEAAVRYDTTPFISQSVEEVYSALFDAVLLVALVVLLFLQDWRAMILPMIDVPVSLCGALAVMYVAGFSLNNLTLFGLVLAVGIVVDDAIVVLENVERWIHEGEPARQATLHAMTEITGAVVATTLVLIAVFVPAAFLGGITGQFYRQFALTIAAAMVFSAVNALTLTPSRAAAIFAGREGHQAKDTAETLPRWGWAVLLGYLGLRLAEWIARQAGVPLPLLTPMPATALDWQGWGQWAGGRALYLLPGLVVGWLVGPLLNRLMRGVYRVFNRAFDRATGGYTWVVGKLLRVTLLVLAGYVGLFGLTGWAFTATPTGYVPFQDKGYLLASVQLPDAASVQRTREVMAQVDKIVRETPGVAHTLGISGQSFVLQATGSNFGTMFIILDEFEKRKDVSLNGFLILRRLSARLAQEVPDAKVALFPPPPVQGLGSAGGYRVMVQDRGDLGARGLEREVNAVLAKLRENPQAGTAFTVYRADVPQLFVDIDRTRCKQMGVPLADVFATLQVYLGGQYVNDFNRFGRVWQVNVQADAPFRITADAIKDLQVQNDRGEMVRLGAVARVEDTTGPVVIQRYNIYPAAAINGNLPAGTSTGEGIRIVEQAADASLTAQAGYEWTELFLLQIREGNQAILVFLAAVVLVYLVLAAQYDSWSLPLAILLVVPMCLLSSIAGVWAFAIAGLLGGPPEVNIFTQVGFVVLVGLASKNAILIVEFAEQQRKAGKPLREATLAAVQLRLRPIIMTSAAFILGVVPLVLASGAGAEMRRAAGIAVFSGMIGVTLFGIFRRRCSTTPSEWLIERRHGKPDVQHRVPSPPAGHDGPPAPVAQPARGPGLA